MACLYCQILQSEKNRYKPAESPVLKWVPTSLQANNNNVVVKEPLKRDLILNV